MQKVRSVNRLFWPKHLFYSPQWLVLGVNNVCNLHCKMCDVGTKNLETNFAQNLIGTKPLNMPLELFQTIVDQTKTHFPKTKLGYAFTEPLVYSHLFDSLDYANKANVFTSITTNALNLRQKADELIAGGLKELFVSLDGPELIHNEIRGHKSSYQRALEGIELISSKSSIPVSIFCVIVEWNTGYLLEFLEGLKHLPLKQVGFMHANFITEDIAKLHNEKYRNNFMATHSNVEETNFSAYDLPNLAAEIGQIKSTKYPFKVTFAPDLSELEQLETYYLHPTIRVGKTCYDVFNNLMIKSDGSVIPSHGRCFNVSVGNLYESNLKEIWNAEKLVELRKLLNKEKGLLPACTRCCSAV